MFNFSKFFLEQRDFSGKKNVDIFEKWNHFLILWIVLKIKLRYYLGVCHPRTTCGGDWYPLSGRAVSPRKKSRRRIWILLYFLHCTRHILFFPTWDTLGVHNLTSLAEILEVRKWKYEHSKANAAILIPKAEHL